MSTILDETTLPEVLFVTVTDVVPVIFWLVLFTVRFPERDTVNLRYIGIRYFRTSKIFPG